MYTRRGFLKALNRGDVETVARYLAPGDAADWLKVRDKQGNTALHIAAQTGNTALISMLLETGAPRAALNEQGYAPIAVAAQYSQRDAVKAFLDAGEDIDQPLPGDMTLLSLSVLRGDKSTADLLIAAKADLNKGQPMLQALYYHHAEMVLRLMEAGADPEATWRDGSRPIHMSAANGHNDALRALLAKGVAIDAQDDAGNTALHLAISRSNAAAVDMLLKAGARTDIENERGSTAFQMAMDSNPQIRRLVEPIVKEQISRGTTALTASATAMPQQDDEVWVPMGRHQIARVGVYPALGRRLTEIFNFEARERMIIAENLKTGAENVTPPASFDLIDERALIAACKAFRENGGEVEESAILGQSKPKAALKPL